MHAYARGLREFPGIFIFPSTSRPRARVREGPVDNFAAVRTLPTPDPSGYVDRESSVVVAFPTGARGFPRWGSGGGVVRNYGTMYAMRPLRNFKTNQCCHLISRIANCAKLDLIDFKPATNVLRFRDMGGSEDE